MLLPCVQNEIEYEDSVKLVNKGVKIVLEGANMPSTNDAIAHFHKCGVVLAAAKACNAGGVAVSGLEMAQNACMSVWTSEEVDNRLKVSLRGVLGVVILFIFCVLLVIGFFWLSLRPGAGIDSAVHTVRDTSLYCVL